MARDAAVIIMLIVIAAAIPEIVGGAVDAVKRRCKRGKRRSDGADENEAPGSERGAGADSEGTG